MVSDCRPVAIGHTATVGGTDTVHDMGGMHGFGAVVPEPDEPVFHEPWEGRVFGLMIVSSAKGLRQGQLRPAIEAIPAAEYLDASYYERWLRAVEAGLARGGTVAPTDIDARVANPVDVAPTADPPFAQHIRGALQRPNQHPPPATPGRFQAGDRVTVVRMAPAGHTRCPRYVRGATGTVAAVHGGWPLPDRGDDSRPETLYTVRFEQTDLWGADAEPGALYIDLWDSYLGAAS
jgi:nitrile hydratase beta subunit